MRYAETSWHHMEPKNTETLEFKFIQKDGHNLQVLNVSFFLRGPLVNGNYLANAF